MFSNTMITMRHHSHIDQTHNRASALFNFVGASGQGMARAVAEHIANIHRGVETVAEEGRASTFMALVFARSPILFHTFPQN
jgi:hypothetical protein